MSARRRKLLRGLLGGVAAIVIVIGLLLAAFGYIVTRVPEYRVQVQDWINERSGLIVEFRSLRARLRFHGPELVFDDAIVRTPDRTRVLATATRGSVGFDWWGALREGRLTAGRFTLVSPQIGLIRTREGRIQLLGQSALPERTDPKPFALEELPTGRFDVEDALVTFRDEITGRGPWSLSGVDFVLTRTSDAMRLRGDASLPNTLGRELSFSATAEGPLEQYQTLVSTFSVEGEALDLAGWADVLPDHWPAPETGLGSLQVSGALSGSQLTQLSAQLDLRDVATALPVWATPLPTAAPMRQPLPDEDEDDDDVDEHEDVSADASAAAAAMALSESHGAPPTAPQMLAYDRLALSLRAQRVGDEWSATIDDLTLAQKESQWRSKQLRARWSHAADGKVTKASATADRIVLDHVWPLLAYLPESRNAARARALNARGVVEDLEVSVERAPDAPIQYDIEARLSNVAFDPIEKAPGLSGLSGAIEATHESGRWRIGEQDIQFSLPRWFRESLSARVTGELAWRALPDGWVVSGENLQVRNEDGQGAATLALTLKPGSSPVLEMTAQGENLRAGSTAKYIPAGRLGARTVEWFDQAFIDGRVTAAEFVYKGPTRSFPFRRGEGLFRVRGHVENAVFSYQPGWMQAHDIVADVEFINEGMSVRATQGAIGELRLQQARAQVKDLKQAEIEIEASARGDLSEGLKFLKSSPLAPKLGETFAKLDGAGAMTTDVRLFLPIKHFDSRDIQVTARLANASAGLRDLDAPVRRLNGAVTVRNTLLAAAKLEGQWLGGPVSVVVTPARADASMLVAQGRLAADRIAPLLKPPPTVALSGETNWRATTQLVAAGEGKRPPQIVNLESDLRGLAIGLPAPLGKNAEEPRALQLALETDGREDALVRGALGDVRALIRLKSGAEGWTLDRGGVRADGAAPALPDHAGLRIEGSVERFVLDDWLALRSEERAGKPLSEYLHAANVRVQEFEAFGYRWADVRGVLQATQAGWRVDVSGAQAEGQILIPHELPGELPLRATMERLVLEKAPARAVRDKEPVDPRKLPALQVYVSDLRVGPRVIGAVDLKASRAPQGLRFDSATVIGAAVQGEGRGHWFMTTDGQHSALDARVTSTDVAAALRALNYSGFIEAKRGEIRADLTWPGGFTGNILEHASGAISVDAETGQIVNLQPGAGRVLGLFSIAALPRRLALDFSDLTEQGLAFDRIHGDFELRDGQAHTSNLVLSGPAAEIGLAGRTGLATRDYDQTAVVTGNLGASLPVAGALAGGPAVGAALLLFSQVFKEPLKGITRGYYRITGPWENPKVERIDQAQAKAETTP